MKSKFVDIKQTIIDNRPTYIEELKIKITELIAILKEFSPYEMFSHLNTLYKTTLLNISSEYDIPGESIELKYTLELLQMIISCIHIEKFKNNSMEENDIFKITKLGSDIFGLKTQYIVSYTYEMHNKDEDLSQYIFEAEIASEITGKRYDVFEIVHYKELFTPLKDHFEKTYQFPLENFFEGLDKLKRKFTFGINESRESMIKIMDSFDKIDSDENLKEKSIAMFDELLGLKLQNVLEITEWPREFIDIFSYSIGENNFSLSDITFERIYDLHKEINRKPVLKIGDGYYYLCIQRLIDNLDRIILKDLYKKNNQAIEDLKKLVANTCEELVGTYIKEIIPTADVSTSNFYKLGKNFCENDLLITFDEYLFVIEVKSGSFTPDVALNNMKSHFDTLKKLVEDADSQVNRFVNELNERKNISIYDSNNKNAKIKKVINIDDYAEIFKLVVTLEGFNEIEARADKVGILKLNKNIIVCSLDDLKVYSDYFKDNPTQFLHYMTYRKMATETKEIELNDELDHLGLYIEYNCYPITAKNLVNNNKNINHIMWEEARKDLDLYYNGLYIENDNKVNKPIQPIPYRLMEMINYVNKNCNSHNIRAVNYLLDLSGEQKEELFKQIEMFVELYKNTGRIKYGCVLNHQKNLVIVSGVIDNDDFDEKKLFDNVYANMQISQSKEAYLLFLYYNNRKKLTKINLNVLTTEDERYSSKIVEKLSEKIKNRRFVLSYQNKKKKIGRNEPCPCKSGLKYKKCCGR